MLSGILIITNISRRYITSMIIQKTLFCGLKSSDGLQTIKNDEKLWISRHGFLLNIFGKVGAMCYICSDIIKRC